MTTNHDYNIPDEGTVDWHIPLNDNFLKLETDVEIRDVDSNRDSYEPKQGGKFLATDTGDVYLGDGSNWNYVGGLRSGGSSSGGGIDDALAAGMVVPVAEGLSAADAIDPRSRSRPVQDALDMVMSTGGGSVYLPPTEITEEAPINWRAFRTELVGTPGMSTINFTSTGSDAHGIVFNGGDDSYPYVDDIRVHGVTLSGPGMGSTTGHAIHDKGINRGRFGWITADNWNNSIYVEAGDGKTFEMRFEYLRVGHQVRTDGNALIDWRAGGAPNHFNYIATSARGYGDVIRHREGSLTVGNLNIGGQPGRAYKGEYGAKGFRVKYINYEPHKSWDGRVPAEIIEINSPRGATHVEQLHFWRDVEYVYHLDGAGQAFVSKPIHRYDTGRDRLAEVHKGYVNATDLGDQCFYYGSSADVDGDETDLVTLG